MFFKTIINSILKKLNYKIINISPTLSNNNFNEIIKFLLQDETFQLKDTKKIIPPISQKKILVFDVGSNFGQSIERFSSIFHNCVIFSFEPNKSNYKILEKKYLKKKNIFLSNLALSDVEQEINFFNYPYGSSSFLKFDMNSAAFKRRQATFLKENPKKSFENVDKVKTNTLDKFCEKNLIDKIDVLKIDTQGHEAEVLNGAIQMLTKQRIKVVELEDMNNFSYIDDKKKIATDILKRMGYHIIAIDKSGNSIVDYEFQNNIIFVCSELKNKIKKHHENKSEKEILKIDRSHG